MGFYMTDTGKVIRKVKTATKKKYKKRMRKLNEQYNSGGVELENIKRVMPGFNGHLKRGNTFYLRKTVLKKFVLVRHVF